jgi:protein involved in polysaccharide export with SLBB domain
VLFVRASHTEWLAPLFAFLALASVAVSASPLAAQTADGGIEPRAQTRAEIEARAASIERGAVALADTAARRQRLAEADAMRARLRDGDFEVGDRVVLRVSGVPALTDTFTVAAGRVLRLPDLGDIPLGGVLRSELQPYLQRQIARYVINPTVEARSMMRVAVLGAVEKPGFYSVPPDMLVGDAVMVAGGLAREADVGKSVVRRGSKEVWTRQRLHRALLDGLTVDQLDLRPGDEIVVGERVRRDWGDIIRNSAYVAAVVASVWAGSRVF